MRVVDHVPAACAGCGAGLTGAPVDADPVVRQVVALPEITTVVTDRRLHAVAHSCGTLTRVDVPAGVPDAPTGHGPGVVTPAVYSHVAQLVPVARTAALLDDVLDVPVSTGWVCGVLARTAGGLEPANETIRTQVRAAPVVGVEEACTKISAVRHWLWTGACQLLCVSVLVSGSGRG